MSSTNKKGAGLILSLLTAVAGAVGLGFCIVNAGTDSFRKIGTSPIVIGCAVIAILALVLRVWQIPATDCHRYALLDQSRYQSYQI